jgi:hypothetical protein
LGQIGGGSSDLYAGSVLNVFDEHHERRNDHALLLDRSTGDPRGMATDPSPLTPW